MFDFCDYMYDSHGSFPFSRQEFLIYKSNLLDLGFFSTYFFVSFILSFLIIYTETKKSNNKTGLLSPIEKEKPGIGVQSQG